MVVISHDIRFLIFNVISIVLFALSGAPKTVLSVQLLCAILLFLDTIFARCHLWSRIKFRAISSNRKKMQLKFCRERLFSHSKDKDLICNGPTPLNRLASLQSRRFPFHLFQANYSRNKRKNVDSIMTIYSPLESEMRKKKQRTKFKSILPTKAKLFLRGKNKIKLKPSELIKGIIVVEKRPFKNILFASKKGAVFFVRWIEEKNFWRNAWIQLGSITL